MESYTPDEKEFMKMIVEKGPGTSDFFQKLVSENFFSKSFRPIMFLNPRNHYALLLFSEHGRYVEFNRFMNLVALMEELEDERLIIRLPVTQEDGYFIGELWDANEEKSDDGEIHYRSRSSGKYIKPNEWSKLYRKWGGPQEVLDTVVFNDPKLFDRLNRAFSGIVYPRESLIDLVNNNFQTVARRRHNQTMRATWTAIAISFIISLASVLLTLNQ